MNKLYVDEKVTTWYRHYFDSEKISKEKLIELVKQNGVFEILNPVLGFESSELLTDSVESMSVKENNNQPTEEIYFGDEDSTIQELIWDNVQGKVKDE